MILNRKLSSGLLTIIGWKVVTDFPQVDKSVMVFAPHTSYWDAVIGKIMLCSLGIPHTPLSKKELFVFPMSIAMRLLGSIPVGGVKGHNAIYDAVDILGKSDKMHLVVCPEGMRSPTNRWNPGFYYMAYRANVPIVVIYMDYAKKVAGVKGVITDLDNLNTVYKQMAQMYKGVTARHPDDFELPAYRA